MSERVKQQHQGKSAVASNPLLATPSISLLTNSSHTLSPQVNLRVADASLQQDPQSQNEQSLEAEKLPPELPGHDLSKISLRPQAKLSVSQPGDVYEQEADRVAVQVMSMPDRTQQQANNESTADRLQRKSVGDLITPGKSDSTIARQSVSKALNLTSGDPIEPKANAGVNRPLAMGHDLSRISLSPVQRKVTIGQPDDPYEREADRVAGEVMRMQVPENGALVMRSLAERLNRKCEACDREENETIQRSSDGSLLIQREEMPPGSLPNVPNYQLTTPSLLAPADPSSRYKLGGDLTLHLDPELQASMQQVQEQVNPTIVRTALSQIKLTLPSADLSTPVTTNPLATPATPAPTATPLVPAGAGPDKPRGAGGSDIMEGILGLPVVDNAVESIKTQASDRFTKDWHRLSTGEKFLGISSVVTIAGGALAGVISDPAARQLALGQLNGKVLPVPGLNWLHLEINTGGDNLMLGLHLDVGRLLPSGLGFKDSAPSAIGGVPEQQPLPIQRKLDSKEDPEGGSNLESQLNASKGGGSPLADEVRSFMEPRFGADFSGVRVHTGSDAVQMNQDVSAQAFAYGQDIYFGAGKAPGNNELTAHELTHVVQQTDTIQRYNANEHAQAGDRAKGGGTITVQGIDVTAGEINALADMYASPDDLRKAEPNELKQLVRLIRKQQVDPNSVSEADWDIATNGRYTQLNLKNSKHFSPSNPALIAPQSSLPTGGDNRSIWKGYHKQALIKANQVAAASHPNQRAELLEEAKLINFFGEHYLTDAFSAGHLLNKDDTLAAIQENLSQQEKQISTIFKNISAKVWATRSSFISKYEAKKYWVWWDLNSAERLQGLLEGIYDEPKGKEAVQSAIVKAAHDRLNTQKNDDGSVGVAVTNDFEEWVLSGDGTLDTSPTTQKWLNKALEQSRTNIQEATQAKVSTEPDQAIKKVLDCLPRPTKNSEKAIHDLLEKVTNPTGGMVDAIADVLSKEIEATFLAVEKEGFIRKKKEK